MTKEQRAARIVKLHREGLSQSAISREVGASGRTVRRVLVIAGLAAPSGHLEKPRHVPTPAQLAIRKAAERIKWLGEKPQDKVPCTYLWRKHEVGVCPTCHQRVYLPCLACEVKAKLKASA